MHYEELTREYAPKWPWPVSYGKENEVSCDVLVLGGGIAGCWAAIAAAKKGVKVALVDKGALSESGSGGAGVDHWHAVVTNPACPISPEEFTLANMDHFGGWRNAIMQYITSRESYDCLLEIEKMGMKIRDTDDEFKGAQFRDEATKLLFAYDYTNKYCARVWGHNVKPTIAKECERLGIDIYNYVFVTSLLTEGGKQGAKVVGATGVNARTGEFYIFKGKASILCMFQCQRQHLLSTEMRSLSHTTHRPPNMTGDGHAMTWKAGAEITAAEQSGMSSGGPMGYIQYGVGNAANTWYACTIVDANGKEIPWVDRDGRILTDYYDRYKPAPGQKFFIGGGGASRDYRYRGPRMLPVKGYSAFGGRRMEGIGTEGEEIEVESPLYADMTSMPEEERRVMFGLMMAQEGRTRIPIYYNYTQAGFDPAKDMLQSYDGGWGGVAHPKWRTATGGGLVIDWNLKTSLDGLYAAGVQLFAPGDHAYAASTGSYAGRNAAAYASGAGEPEIDRRQVDAEKTRAYAPVQREGGMEWKELNMGICKVMQDYCGEVKNEELLKLGLKWLDEIERGEATTAFARNPHELVRVLEVFNILTNGQMIMEASRARKASNSSLGFMRSDYPEIDPPEWRKWITIKQDQGTIKTGELPLDFHGDLEKNYQENCQL